VWVEQAPSDRPNVADPTVVIDSPVIHPIKSLQCGRLCLQLHVEVKEGHQA
jgi:hypothetical protein